MRDSEISLPDSPEAELPADVARELWNRREELLRVTAQLVAAALSRPGFELPEVEEELGEWVARHAEVAEAIIGHADASFDASVQGELGVELPDGEETEAEDPLQGLP